MGNTHPQLHRPQQLLQQGGDRALDPERIAYHLQLPFLDALAAARNMKSPPMRAGYIAAMCSQLRRMSHRVMPTEVAPEDVRHQAPLSFRCPYDRAEAEERQW
jgi:hypothetical protein